MDSNKFTVKIVGAQNGPFLCQSGLCWSHRAGSHKSARVSMWNGGISYRGKKICLIADVASQPTWALSGLRRKARVCIVNCDRYRALWFVDVYFATTVFFFMLICGFAKISQNRWKINCFFFIITNFQLIKNFCSI